MLIGKNRDWLLIKCRVQVFQSDEKHQHGEGSRSCKTVNVLNFIELYAVERLIVCYVNFSPIFKKLSCCELRPNFKYLSYFTHKRKLGEEWTLCFWSCFPLTVSQCIALITSIARSKEMRPPLHSGPAYWSNAWSAHPSLIKCPCVLSLLIRHVFFKFWVSSHKCHMKSFDNKISFAFIRALKK